jgi:hypothetical protein
MDCSSADIRSIVKDIIKDIIIIVGKYVNAANQYG